MLCTTLCSMRFQAASCVAAMLAVARLRTQRLWAYKVDVHRQWVYTTSFRFIPGSGTV